MSDKCYKRATLKLARGEELDCGQDNKCSTVTLNSMNGEVIGTYSPYAYHFYDGKLGYGSVAGGKFTTMGKDLLLKVEKIQGELKLTVHREDGSKVQDLDVSSIKGFKNIDFEQYLNAKEPQIHIKEDTTNPYISRAVLYDNKGNEIGKFVDESAAFQDERLKYESDDGYSYNPDNLNVAISKIDGNYQLHYRAVNNQTWDTSWNSQPADIENVNIDYNVLDKIMIPQKGNPYCQADPIAHSPYDSVDIA